HCPFTIAQKNAGGREFHRTPNGMPGVETLFPLLYTYGVCAGRIRIDRLLEVLAKNPAAIFGIHDRKGKIRPGADADLVVWDPGQEWMIPESGLHSNADWSPYAGLRIAGQVDCTILRGEILVEQGEFCGDSYQGELLLSKD
ncbi:MAG: amidohydrolase family protein, partial [bacterium]